MSWFQVPSLPSLCHCRQQPSQPRSFSGAARSRIRVLTRSSSQAPLGLPISERDACVRPGLTLLAGPDAELAGEGRGALASLRRLVNFPRLIPIGHCYPREGGLVDRLELQRTRRALAMIASALAVVGPGTVDSEARASDVERPAVTGCCRDAAPPGPSPWPQ